ncbi:3-deoxy-D-manno-octulosonic-acid transferase [Parelusimicrobium proximum]
MNLLVPFGLVGLLVYFVVSPRRGLLRKLKDELRERMVLYPESEVPKGHIWLHAASVGEVNSMTGMIPLISKFYNKPVLVTTNTMAGKVAALKKEGVAAAFLMPFDSYFFSKKFVRYAKPYRMFVVEGELWPNAIMAASASGAEIIILNGRMSPRSAKRYKLIRSLYSLLMGKITFATLQNDMIRDRYVSLGLNPANAYATGNVKYDNLNQSPTKLKEVESVLAKLKWQGKTVFVCGSTHGGEEALIESCAEDFAGHNICTVIAPRHLERKEVIIEKLSKRKIKFALLSKINEAPAGATILFADAMGWLSSFYKCADIAFVGGTIVQKGGHNLLEPAVLGTAVLFGPYVYNTPDTAAELIKREGGAQVDKDNFKETVITLAGDKEKLSLMSARAKDTALSFAGATEKIMELIKKYEHKQ